MTKQEVLENLLSLGAVSLGLLMIGIQVFRGHWLHLLGGNIFGDADAELRKNRGYRRYGIFLMVLSAATWLLWWVPNFG